jgi:hypothetical protein
VFYCSEEEQERACALRDRLAALMTTDDPVPALMIGCVAAYFSGGVTAGGRIDPRLYADPKEKVERTPGQSPCGSAQTAAPRHQCG